MNIDEFEKSYREGLNALAELIAVMSEMENIITASDAIMSSDKASENDKLIAHGAKQAMEKLVDVMRPYEEID